MINVVIVRSTSVVYDARVLKIAKSLNKRYSTLVLGWNREELSKKVVGSFPVPLKLHKQRASYGKPSLVARYPLFWMWILFQLAVARPRVVHACDLDTVLPCYLYKVIFRKKLVYDIFDRYALANIPRKFSVLFSFVNLLEDLFSKNADTLIIVAENILGTFKRTPEHYTIIRNCPEHHTIDSIKSINSKLTLVYTGNVIRFRGLERITEAIKNLDGIELVFAGRIIDKEFFEYVLKTPNVKYMGHMLPVDALSLEANSDVMVILYDLDIPNHRFANPNKTFEAMMFELPVITNLTPELIREANCGILVDYNNVSQIQSAVITLRDNPELGKRLGNNGRIAFEQKYNWDVMEKELYQVYERLLKD